jgi:hypothetical protein
MWASIFNIRVIAKAQKNDDERQQFKSIPVKSASMNILSNNFPFYQIPHTFTQSHTVHHIYSISRHIDIITKVSKTLIWWEMKRDFHSTKTIYSRRWEWEWGLKKSEVNINSKLSWWWENFQKKKNDGIKNEEKKKSIWKMKVIWWLILQSEISLHKNVEWNCKAFYIFYNLLSIETFFLYEIAIYLNLSLNSFSDFWFVYAYVFRYETNSPSFFTR